MKDSILVRWMLICACVGSTAAPLHAQGSAADYERAATLRRATANLVEGTRFRGEWLSPHELLVRSSSKEGAEEFQLFDGSTGRVTALSKDEADVRKRSVADRERLQPSRARRSSNGSGTEVELLFRNEGSEAVELYWIDTGGEPHAYGSLPPGAERAQHTYDGHVWQAIGPGQKSWGHYRASADGTNFVVFDGAVANPPRSREARPREERSRAMSPDGVWRVVPRDHNLWLQRTESEQEIALTTDGTAEDAYTSQIWWAPNARHFVVMRVAREEEHLVHLIESAPADRVQPKLQSFQYLKPGDRIAHARPYLFDAMTGKAIEIDRRLMPTPWSITRCEWMPDSSAFTCLYNQRGHQILRWLAIDPKDGSVRALIEEQSPTFIDYAGKLWLEPLYASKAALWMSERSGWNHLYRFEFDHPEAPTPITSGQWLVKAIERIDQETQQIWFRAVGVYPNQDPYYEHFGRVGFDGTGLTWLTSADGTHELRYGPGGEYYVDTYSRVDRAPVHELHRASDGALISELGRADDAALRATGWQAPIRFVAKGRDGATDIHGILVLPSNFDSKLRYPVIENIYAGPQGQFVPKRFDPWMGSRAIAELGFVVAHIDGMGTNWRSKAFHDKAWKNLADAGFPDRIAWLRAAADKYEFLDLDRVGIYGGSAGGQNSLGGLLWHGDFYRVGVADCGCHDNRMDKIWWNELWMGWPIGPHYDEQSNVTQAHRLQGKLLLICGELDRNVDPASTMQVAAALVRADKDFDLLVIPGAGHGAAETPYGSRRRADFFVRHLLQREPRWKP